MAAAQAGRRFAGTSILVVGAATGIGRATAERLAAEGARVGVADLDLQEATAAAAALPGSGHLGLELDVLTPQSIADAVAAFGAQTGAIDALVHVAGGDTAHGDFEHTADDTWRAMLDLNLLGPVRVAREALPWLRRSTRAPAIVVVGSINASVTLGSEPYSAAKAGLASVVANLAAELGPRRDPRQRRRARHDPDPRLGRPGRARSPRAALPAPPRRRAAGRRRRDRLPLLRRRRLDHRPHPPRRRRPHRAQGVARLSRPTHGRRPRPRRVTGTTRSSGATGSRVVLRHELADAAHPRAPRDQLRALWPSTNGFCRTTQAAAADRAWARAHGRPASAFDLSAGPADVLGSTTHWYRAAGGPHLAHSPTASRRRALPTRCV